MKSPLKLVRVIIIICLVVSYDLVMLWSWEYQRDITHPDWTTLRIHIMSRKSRSRQYYPLHADCWCIKCLFWVHFLHTLYYSDVDEISTSSLLSDCNEIAMSLHPSESPSIGMQHNYHNPFNINQN